MADDGLSALGRHASRSVRCLTSIILLLCRALGGLRRRGWLRGEEGTRPSRDDDELGGCGRNEDDGHRLLELKQSKGAVKVRHPAFWAFGNRRTSKDRRRELGQLGGMAVDGEVGQRRAAGQRAVSLQATPSSHRHDAPYPPSLLLWAASAIASKLHVEGGRRMNQCHSRASREGTRRRAGLMGCESCEGGRGVQERHKGPSAGSCPPGRRCRTFKPPEAG